MSQFLSNCLRGAIISALGSAMLSFIFTMLTIVILGLVTGPGAVIAAAAALPIALAGALIFGAVVLISLILTCIIEDNRSRAEVTAGAPGGGGQALEEDKKAPRCRICEMYRKNWLKIGSAVGIVTGIGISVV